MGRSADSPSLRAASGHAYQSAGLDALADLPEHDVETRALSARQQAGLDALVALAQRNSTARTSPGGDGWR